MIVHWNKFQKRENKSHKDISNKSKPLVNGNIVTIFEKGEDNLYEPFTSSTSMTSNPNILDFKDFSDQYELDLSDISTSLNKDMTLEEDSEETCHSLLLQLEYLFNLFGSSDPTESYSHDEFITRNFAKVINCHHLFNCLMKTFNKNAAVFIQKNFCNLIHYSFDLITNPISYSLLSKSFPYFSTDQNIKFYKNVIKKHFDLIIKNQYGIEVLTQYIRSCLNEAIIMSLMNIIIFNFSRIITNENASKIINTLLNLNNTFVTDNVIQAIGDNTLAIALSSNGVHITRTFIKCSNLSNKIIEELLKNISIILVHRNGHKIIELLLNLNISSVSLFIINNLLSNIQHISNQDFYLLLVEKTFKRFDSELFTQLNKTLSNKEILHHLLQSHTGTRIILNNLNDLTQSSNQFFIRNINKKESNFD